MHGDDGFLHELLKAPQSTKGGPGIATTFPALYVYDLMFQRGEIAPLALNAEQR